MLTDIQGSMIMHHLRIWLATLENFFSNLPHPAEPIIQIISKCYNNEPILTTSDIGVFSPTKQKILKEIKEGLRALLNPEPAIFNILSELHILNNPRDKTKSGESIEIDAKALSTSLANDIKNCAIEKLKFLVERNKLLQPFKNHLPFYAHQDNYNILRKPH